MGKKVKILYYPLNGKQFRANLPGILSQILLSFIFINNKDILEKIFFRLDWHIYHMITIIIYQLIYKNWKLLIDRKIELLN